MAELGRASRDTRVHIVGAGLVGTLLSVVLGKRGYPVTLWEARPDPKKLAWAAGRSINLAISTRGLHSLSLVGLKETVLDVSIRMPGRQVHTEDTEFFQPYGIHDWHCIHSVSRSQLNEILLNEARNIPQLEIRFSHYLERFDREAEAWVTRNDVTGEEIYLSPGPVMGCDGAGSAARKVLGQSGECFSAETLLDYGYREIFIPPLEGTGKHRWQPNALHIWPRHQFMLIALPNRDGSFTGTLFLPFEGPTSFATLSSKPRAIDFLRAAFPKVFAEVPSIADCLVDNPIGKMGTVKVNPWSSTKFKCLLLGDAAHAIVPFYGQGMNCGFEDVAVLDSILSRGADLLQNFDKVAADFFVSRKRHSDSIAEMALENFVEMRSTVSNKEFQLQKELEKHLEKECPGKYLSRYTMVSFTRIPYGIAYEAGEIQKQFLKKWCAGKASLGALDMDAVVRDAESKFSSYYSIWEEACGTRNSR